MTLRTITLFILCVLQCYTLVAFQAAAWPNLQLEKVAINTSSPESNPQLSPDNKHLYFTRKGHTQNVGTDDLSDAWRTYRLPEGKWSRAINLGSPVNTRHTNSIIGLNQSNNILYIKTDNKVAFSRRAGRSWESPVKMTIEDFYDLSPQSFFQVDLKGKILLMAIQRQEGKGARDLYVSFRQGEKNWSKPKSLGQTLNTAGDESAVFLAADGQTLYFVSNGHTGIGGSDIYMSVRMDESWTRWSKPQNLGAGINTPLDESSICVATSGDRAIFTRSTSSGESDLYEIQLPKALQPLPVSLITGRLLDNRNQPIQGKLDFRNLDKLKITESLITQADGQYQMIIPYGERRTIYIVQEGYFPLSDHLHFTDQGLEELDFDQSNYLTALQNEEGYLRHRVEIEKLQSKLQTIDQELQDLNKIRRTYKVMQQDSIPSQTKKRGVKKGSSKEVEEMKEKFNKHYNRKNKKKEAKEDVEDEFLWEVDDELVNEIHQEMKDSLDAESLKQLKLKEAQLKAQIKASFSSTDRMKENIKNALRTEIKYQTKKGVQEELQRELDAKVQEQIIKEKQWVAKGISAPTAIPPSYQKIQKDFTLIPIEKDEVIPLHNIFFKPNSAEFKPTSFEELERLVTFLKKHPSLELEISGHTNGWIAHSMAQDLSIKRAKRVVDFLIEQGISNDRLQHRGYGKTRPIASNDTLEGRRLNQRIEVKLLKI